MGAETFFEEMKYAVLFDQSSKRIKFPIPNILSIQISVDAKIILLVPVQSHKYRSSRYYMIAMRVPNVISSLLSEQP